MQMGESLTLDSSAIDLLDVRRHVNNHTVARMSLSRINR